MKPRNPAFIATTFGVALVVLLLLYFGSRDSHDFSALRAEYSVESGDIGIPGITKMYDAKLINTGGWPVRIEVCKFQDDAGGRGDAPAFWVQRYDAKSSTWVTIVDASGARSCHPYPLGWVTANLKARWLWPGQSVVMGEEATAARGFHKGESGRFVLFTSFKHADTKLPHAVPTPSFVIDEEAETGAEGLRVRH